MCLQTLQIYRSLAVSPGLGDRYGDVPMFTRATSLFIGKEWFGNISIKMEREGETECTSYGQLRLLFRCYMMQEQGEVMKKELCLLRMYEEVEFDALLKCPILRFHQNGDGSYKVVEIASILKVVQVIPHFVREGNFFLNVYKF